MKRKSTMSVLFTLIFVMNLGCTSSYELTLNAKQIIDSFEKINKAEKIDLLKGTEYSTPAYIFDSGREGKSILILGGTHGNEPAGYEAALRLLNSFESKPPLNGKIIIIPLANIHSVNNYARRVPVPEGVDMERGNLNRCYPGKEDGLPMEQMASQIEKLCKEYSIDIFIDMHEARYFHLNTPKESNRDQGLGQTIIYYPNDESSWIVMNLLDGINERIENNDEKFSAVEMPIKNSAAWWAGKYLNIPAFTFETMRKMDLDKRINYHLELVKIVFKLNDIW
ncbi:MAG: hypothetical protein GY936_16560 [Ignavibacteriae bacterium]|nr:hypothetical protein [Ignavibacteriota bacterium]